MEFKRVKLRLSNLIHVSKHPGTGHDIRSGTETGSLPREVSMTTTPRLRRAMLFAVSISLLTSPAFAQSTPASDQAPPDESTAGKVESLTEQVQTMQADVDKLKRFKFSGYLQVRWEHSEDQSDSVKVANNGAVTANNRERFYIRRARLKLTYDSSPLSQGVLYFDARDDRITRLLEAYVTLLDPWTPDHRHGFTIGQINVPFGYELERSSSVRELPERSRAENVLFPGERDRGAKIVSQWTPQIETVVSVLNGEGINSTNFPTTDPTSNKDYTARLRFSQGTIDVCGSWYDGQVTTPLTGQDIETDKTRYGADAQLYYAAPSVGGGSLKGEYYSGTNLNSDSLRVLVPVPPTGGPLLLRPGADATHLATDFVGWYVMWVQNVGEKLQFAARYDTFDPNQDLDHDQFERWNVGLNWFYDGYTRITASYETPVTERLVGGKYVDPKDNLWTIQFQHKF